MLGKGFRRVAWQDLVFHQRPQHMLAQPDAVRHFKAFSGVKLLSPEMRGDENTNQESNESTGFEVSHGNLLEGAAYFTADCW
jgi:hypothetical protein